MQDQLEIKKIDPLLIIGTTILLWAVVAPHFFHLKTPLLLIYSGLILWRFLAIFIPKIRPTKGIIFATLVLVLIAYWQLYKIPLGRDSAIALLVAMLGLKVLEIKIRRDLYITIFLGYFAIITQFLFNSNLFFSLYLFTILFALTFVLLQMNQVDQTILWKQNFKTVGMLLAQAIPIGLMVFVLFPRFEGPLWKLNIPENHAKTGLSDEMNPGSIGDLSQSNALAFRASFKGHVPPASERYWRGPVLWDTNGKIWKAGRAISSRKLNYQPLSEKYDYQITLEPSYKRWLFALDLPATVPKGAQVTDDYRLLLEHPLTQRKIYDMSSYTQFKNIQLNQRELQRALELPNNIQPRVHQFAKKIADSTNTPKEALDKILQYFNQNPFYYSLRPPILGEHPTDEFLFETKKGFCGHYSSAFAILSRAMGIPARVVTGYQGGEYNPRGNYFIVRQNRAHAWVEVWLKDKGWTRYDPTAAVAPERIEEDFEYNEEGAVSFNMDPNFIAQLYKEAGWMVDTIQLRWQQWVVNFDNRQQQQFFKKFGLENLALEKIIMGAVGFALFILTLAMSLFLYQERIHKPAVIQIFNRFCKKIQKIGITHQANEGPDDFLKRILKQKPALKSKVKPIIQHYIALRYAAPNKVELKTFKRLVQQFKI